MSYLAASYYATGPSYATEGAYSYAYSSPSSYQNYEADYSPKDYSYESYAAYS